MAKIEPSTRLPRFIVSAKRLDQCPPLDAGEVAFIGRSNVGKSSLLGALLKQPTLVKRSRHPGTTQLMNFFETPRHEVLVDLPGYGYAKVPAALRRELGETIERYIAERDNLRGLFLLVDSRRDGLSEDDQAWYDFALHQGRRVQIVLTKIDKTPKAKRRPLVAALARAMGADPEALISFSAMSGEGLGDVQKALRAMLEGR